MKKVTIDDIKTINNFYKKSNSELGYNSFTGTYSTCLGHNLDLYYEVLNKDIFCYVAIDPKTNEKYVTPLYLGTDPLKGAFLLKNYCLKNNIRFGAYIDGNLVKYLKPLFNIKPETKADYEVIYPIERFTEFHKIESQKRRANIFFKNNSGYQLQTYNKIYKSEVLKLVEYWENKSDHPTNFCDNIITKFFTDNYESLPILGFLLLVKNKLAAFLFGEIINNKIFIFNVVKAKREIKGVYQALYNLVCNHKNLKNIEYINGTNLTNVEGLRESKLRLKPSKMIIPWEFDFIK